MVWVRVEYLGLRREDEGVCMARGLDGLVVGMETWLRLGSGG